MPPKQPHTARRVVAVILFSPLACGAACRGTPQVGFAIALPADLADSTAWFEVGAFRDGRCGALAPLLRGGIPGGADKRVAFRRDVPVGPKIGDLPRASYAFAAVARGDDCAVLATGCVEADVGDTDSVLVPMSAVDAPAGQCGAGATCQAARCVPANDDSNPSVGAGCSLELVGSGPLANPVGSGENLVSAPAIAPAGAGFLIVYREIDPNSASARLTLLPIDEGAGARDPLRPGLPGRCATSNEVDGIGIAVNGESGMVVLARAPCDENPALELLNFKTTPELGTFLVATSPNPTPVLLSPARAVAGRSNGNVVVYTEGGAARIASMDAERGIVGVASSSAPTRGTFGGSTTGITDAWVAASDSVLALLAAGKGAPKTETRSPTDGGGADESDAGIGGGDVDAGADTPTLRLQVLPASTSLSSLDADGDRPEAPIVFPGDIGAIAVRDARVIVASNGDGPGRSVTFRAFDVGEDTPALTDGFSVDGQEKVTGVDVALHGDRAYFVAIRPGGISLHVYGGASTTPIAIRSVELGREPRISGIETIRDGRVAVAVTDSRVGVVWTTAKSLTRNDHTGGYAVFACTE